MKKLSEHNSNASSTTEIALEKPLSDSQGFLDGINNAFGIIEFALDGTILWANDNYLKIMGYRFDEIIGKNHSILFFLDRTSSLEYKNIWQNIMKGECQTSEFRRLRKTGEEVWLHACYTPIVDKNNKLIKIIKVASDITLQKKMSVKYEELLKSIDKSTAIIEFDMDGMIMWANELFLSIVGYSLSEIREKHDSIFLDSSLAQRHINREFWDELNRGEFKTGEFKLIHKSGSVVWIRGSYNPILDVKGKPYKVVKFAFDITEQKNLEKLMVEERQKQAQIAKNLALGEMLGGLSHEINNPLTYIIGKIQQIRSQFESNEINYELLKPDLEKVENTAKRIAKIISRMRLLSKSTDNDLFEPHLISDIIENTLDLCRERFKNNLINFKISVIDDSYINCKHVQISQVILNLLNNSYDAIEEMEEKWIEMIVKNKNENTIEIKIIDSGKGIKLEVAKKLMTPFFTTKEVGKGMGLGLSISNSIIENHGGKLYLDPSPLNTCFIIELPRFIK